jgi:hypothetical protein
MIPKPKQKFEPSKVKKLPEPGAFSMEEDLRIPGEGRQTLKANYNHEVFKGIKPENVNRMMSLADTAGIGPTELLQILQTKPKAPYNAMMDYVLQKKNKEMK